MRLDQAQLSEHWHKYREAQDPAARAALIDAYRPLVETLAAMAYARRVTEALSYEDILHYGMTGLLEALDRYSSEHGADFKTYASFRIKGEIYNGITQSTEVSSQIAASKARIKARIESLQNEHEDVLGKLIEQSIGLAIGFMLDDTNIYQYDINKPGPYDAVYRSYELKELAERLAALVKKLSEEQQQIIQYHYFQHKEFADIAVELNLSRSRISQLHREALARLRRLYLEYCRGPPG